MSQIAQYRAPDLVISTGVGCWKDVERSASGLLQSHTAALSRSVFVTPKAYLGIGSEHNLGSK